MSIFARRAALAASTAMPVPDPEAEAAAAALLASAQPHAAPTPALENSGNRRGKGKKLRKKAQDENEDENEDEDEDEDADDDEEDDEEEDGDDESDDEELRRGKKSRKACARRRERARIAHVLTSAEAAGNPALAMHLALRTNIGRQAALDMLRASPVSAQPGSLQDRMSAYANRAAPPGAASLTEKQRIDASWDKAFAGAAYKV
jgi:hypothetical protein